MIVPQGVKVGYRRSIFLTPHPRDAGFFRALASFFGSGAARGHRSPGPVRSAGPPGLPLGKPAHPLSTGSTPVGVTGRGSPPGCPSPSLFAQPLDTKGGISSLPAIPRRPWSIHADGSPRQHFDHDRRYVERAKRKKKRCCPGRRQHR